MDKPIKGDFKNFKYWDKVVEETDKCVSEKALDERVSRKQH